MFLFSLNFLDRRKEYIYDKVGNRLSENSQEGGKTRRSVFQYDKDYRLISADYGNGNRELFVYDAAGNR
jgi:hypothetical protein